MMIKLVQQFKQLNPRLLKAAVYGANDGIVTTFAVMAGVVGAQLSSEVVIILGFANLFADGISMGLGDFIGERSERKLRIHRKIANSKGVKDCNDEVEGKVWETGLVTFISFIIAGFAPIFPFILNITLGLNFDQFLISLLTTGTALFLVGASRTLFIKGNLWKNGLEMLFVGMFAALVAYLFGHFARQIIG